MKRLIFAIMLGVVAWSWAALAQEGGALPATFIYSDGQAEMGHIRRFHWRVLEAALDRTRKTHGDYRLVVLPAMPVSRQEYELTQEHPLITVAVFNSTADRARHILPVRIPVDQGLLGYRLLLIREADQARFDAIRSLDDLKSVRFGLMPWWSDARIMRSAEIPVVEGDSYDGLFRMLSAHRFDAFSRGTTEIMADVERAKAMAPDLVIERHLALHYPMPVYFWFADDQEGRRRADRVRAGLMEMVADGSLAAMVRERYRADLAELDLGRRRIFEIPNPLLDGKDPLDDERLWFHP